MNLKREKEEDIANFLVSVFFSYFFYWLWHYHFRDIDQCLKERNYIDNTLAWDRPGVGQAALYMFMEAIVLCVLIILIEVNFDVISFSYPLVC